MGTRWVGACLPAGCGRAARRRRGSGRRGRRAMVAPQDGGQQLAVGVGRSACVDLGWRAAGLRGLRGGSCLPHRGPGGCGEPGPAAGGRHRRGRGSDDSLRIRMKRCRDGRIGRRRCGRGGCHGHHPGAGRLEACGWHVPRSGRHAGCVGRCGHGLLPPLAPGTPGQRACEDGQAGPPCGAARRDRTAGAFRGPTQVGQHPRGAVGDSLRLPRGRRHQTRTPAGAASLMFFIHVPLPWASRAQADGMRGRHRARRVAPFVLRRRHDGALRTARLPIQGLPCSPSSS